MGTRPWAPQSEHSVISVLMCHMPPRSAHVSVVMAGTRSPIWWRSPQTRHPLPPARLEDSLKRTSIKILETKATISVGISIWVRRDWVLTLGSVLADKARGIASSPLLELVSFARRLILSLGLTI